MSLFLDLHQKGNLNRFRSKMRRSLGVIASRQFWLVLVLMQTLMATLMRVKGVN